MFHKVFGGEASPKPRWLVRWVWVKHEGSKSSLGQKLDLILFTSWMGFGVDVRLEVAVKVDPKLTKMEPYLGPHGWGIKQNAVRCGCS